MRYSRLLWDHDSPGEPVEISSEYDDDGWETRKVEVFAGGAVGFAGNSVSAGGTRLSLIRRPSDAEVVAEPEFRVIELTASEFERAWDEARAAARVEAG